MREKTPYGKIEKKHNGQQKGGRHMKNYEELKQQAFAKIDVLQCIRIFTDPEKHAAMKVDFEKTRG